MKICLRHFILLILLISVAGCDAYVKRSREHQALFDRSTYFPIALYTTNTAPAIESKAYTDDIAGVGSVKCLVGTFAFTFGLLAPLCAPIAVMDGINIAEAEERQHTFEIKTESLANRLEKLSDTSLLRMHAMRYLNENKIDAHDVTAITSDSDTSLISKRLENAGFPVAFEMSLLLVQFYQEREKYCLKMQITARTLTNGDNQEIAKRDKVTSECKTLVEWSSGETLENEVSSMYVLSAQYLINQLLFVYEDLADNVIGLMVLKPIPNFGEVSQESSENEDEEVECDSIEQDCWEMEPIYKTVKWKPKLYKNLEPSIGKLYFTDVGLTPEFVWSELKLPGATDISYDLHIFKGKQEVGSGSLKWKGTYADSQWVVLDEVIYKKENLRAATFKLKDELEPCSWYFWTVRAKFKKDGNFRMTDWSAMDYKYYTTSYPIRTPASGLGPSCWDKEVYWGPCNSDLLASERICIK